MSGGISSRGSLPI